MTTIILDIDSSLDGIEVCPFQALTTAGERVVFQNNCNETMRLTFSACHPLPLIGDSFVLPPQEKVSFLSSREIHFAYVARSDNRPRPRSAIITVLQPVGRKGSEDLIDPGLAKEPDCSHVTDRARIVIRKGALGLIIEPSVLEGQLGESIVFLNHTQQSQKIQFLATSPFASSNIEIQVGSLEKVVQTQGNQLRFTYAVMEEGGQDQPQIGTVIFSI